MATEMDWRGHDESLGGVLSDFFESPEGRAKMGAGHAAGRAAGERKVGFDEGVATVHIGRDFHDDGVDHGVA